MDAPSPSTLNSGCTPQESFLVKETALLATFPRLSRIQVLHGPVPEDKLDTVQGMIHPNDWPKFVVGDMLFKEMRFHKDFMLLPKYALQKLTFDDDTVLTTNIDPHLILITDEQCASLNRRLYKANTTARKKRVMEAQLSVSSKKAETYRYVTLSPIIPLSMDAKTSFPN